MGEAKRRAAELMGLKDFNEDLKQQIGADVAAAAAPPMPPEIQRGMCSGGSWPIGANSGTGAVACRAASSNLPRRSPMAVRAKFVVTEKSDTHSNTPHGAGGEHHSQTVKLSAVYGDDNKNWSKWTPCGQIQMTISNPEAYDQLKLGQAYFVDFTLAPAKEADEKK